MIKQQIQSAVNEIDNIDDYKQIQSFFIFLIALRKQHKLTKEQLYEFFMEIMSEEQHLESLRYEVITVTMDYFIGCHAPLTPDHYAYDFVRLLNWRI